MTMPRLVPERSYDDMTYKAEGSRKDTAGSLSPFTFLCIALILTLLGLVALYTSSYMKAIEIGLPHYWYFMRQALVAAVSLAFGALLTMIPTTALEKGYLAFLPLALVLILLQLVPGFSSDGYLAIGGTKLIQTGSVAMLALVFTISGLMPDRDEDEGRIRRIALSYIAIAAVLGLTLVASGISWYAVSSLLVLLMLRRRGCGKAALVLTLLFMLVTGMTVPVLYPHLLSPFFSSILPVNDPSLYEGALIAAREAVASAGIAGTGLGAGIYKHEAFSGPESQFVFATYAEELGVVGVIFLLILLFLFLVIGIRTSKRGMQKEREKSASIAYGLTLMIVLKAFANILYVTGVLPLPGILLPFFSYSLPEEAITILSSVMLYRLVYMMGRE